MALNAAKARAMAKQVGVIPDSESAWKYALRNLRDGQGQPLQGKALDEAKAKLGDLSNNAFQKLKSVDRKQGKASTKNHEPLTAYTEFYGDVDGKGNLLRVEKGLQGTIPPGYQGNYHTHGSLYSKVQAKLMERISPGVGRAGYPNRVAKPSGDHSNPYLHQSRYLRDISGPYSKAQEQRMLRDRLEERLTLAKAKGVSDYSPEAIALRGELAGVEMKRLDSSIDLDIASSPYPKASTHPNADIGIIAMAPKSRQAIAAPKAGVVSVNKVSNNGLRTVYFQHK